MLTALKHDQLTQARANIAGVIAMLNWHGVAGEPVVTLIATLQILDKIGEQAS